MVSKLVAFRLPDEIIQAIESEARATGKDKTAVVVQALRQFFNLPSSEPTTVEKLQKQVVELEAKVDKLSEQVSKNLP